MDKISKRQLTKKNMQVTNEEMFKLYATKEQQNKGPWLDKVSYVSLTPALRRNRQADFCKFKANMIYIEHRDT